MKRIATTAVVIAITILTISTVGGVSVATPTTHARTYFAQTLNGKSPAYRPKHLAPVPGPNLFFRHMKWSSWTTSKARGHGVALSDDCTPDCASGHYRHDSATVVLTHPGSSCGKEFFFRMHVDYTSKHFPSTIDRHQTYIVQPDMCGDKPAT